MKYLQTILVLLLFCSCQRMEEKKQQYQGEEKELFDDLPLKPSSDDPFFIIANDGIKNRNLYDAFLEESSKGKDTQIIIARYTIEGDAIYELLKYENGIYTLLIDNSRDRFGKSNPVKETGSHLYSLIRRFEEETDGEMRQYEEEYCFISDLSLNEEELNETFEKMKEGQSVGLCIVFSSFNRIMKKQS